MEKIDFKVIGSKAAGLPILKNEIRQILGTIGEHWKYSEYMPSVLQIMSKYCHYFVSIIDRFMSILISEDIRVLDPEHIHAINSSVVVLAGEFDAEAFLRDNFSELFAKSFELQDWMEFMMGDSQPDSDESLAIDLKFKDLTIDKNTCKVKDQQRKISNKTRTKGDNLQENIADDCQLDIENLAQMVLSALQ